MAAAPVLEVYDLHVEARSAAGRVAAVRGLNLSVAGGERFGIIGESGSGKTTTVRATVGLLERNVAITRGEIRFQGRTVRDAYSDRLASIRGRHIGMVFQSPRASLNPLRTIGSQLREVLHVHRPELSRADVGRRIGAVLSRMRFPDVAAVLRSYPHELSGGMCQRAAIGLAIAVEPELVLADECTSALDVTTQAEVTELLRELCSDGRRSLVFVTHDLLLAADVCTRIAVMYAGEIVECGPVDDVLGDPKHPYTQGLLRAVPAWEPSAELTGIEGSPAPVPAGFTGCGFRGRCAHATAACSEPVSLVEVGPGHGCRCVLVGGAAVPADAVR